MIAKLIYFIVLAVCVRGVHPVPSPVIVRDLDRRLFNPIAGLTGAVEKRLAELATKLADTQPTSTPTSIPDAVATLKSIFGPKPTGIITNGLKFLTSGLKVDGTDGVTINSPAPPDNINSFKNSNPEPPTPVFPAANGDAPFSLNEQQLRSAIFIPAAFQGMGMAPNPVILVPGTGALGGVNFVGNFAKVMALNQSIAQPVWLNIPGAMLDDVQTNAEYIAYAIKYMSSLTGAKVCVLGWSQGNLATQWVMKYWPTARNATKQLISISPDFHGTLIANIADLPIIDKIPLPPSILQQQSNSRFVRTLRAGGGDSAYVPTTTLYSSVFDEIVQPQAGTGASAFIKDARNVGVSNNEIQRVCPGTPAGEFGTHESLLFNGLSMAIAIDALSNGGPADLTRIDLSTVCQQLAHPALNVTDVNLTEGLIPLAGLNVLEYRPGVTKEPAIRSYAK